MDITGPRRKIDNQVLGIGKYAFTISATVANPFGVAIDGNGDGVGGDEFQRLFDVAAAPFSPLAPLGALIYESSFNDSISTAGQVDSIIYDLDAGNQLGLTSD